MVITNDNLRRPGDGQAPPFDEWCIVELLGHRRVAARVRETTLAGAGMLRLDIPATAGHPAQTQYVSPGSVYALHPTTEAIATAMAASYRPEPVSRYELARALPAEPVTVASTPPPSFTNPWGEEEPGSAATDDDAADEDPRDADPGY